MSIAVVSAHFNFCGYESRRRNLEQFVQHVAAARGVDEFLLVECVAPGGQPEAANAIVVEGDRLWQKERLLQIGAEIAIGRGHEKIALLDADIQFEDSEWPGVIADCLDHWMFIQAFESVDHKFSDRIASQKSALSTRSDAGARGIAFAARADFFRRCGLYQHAIIGGGDSLHTKAALKSAGCRQTELSRFGNRLAKLHYDEWANKFHRVVGDRWGFAPLHVTAMPHGSWTNRKYPQRHKLIADFNPFTDVRHDVRGALRWATDKPFTKAVADYFAARQEDT